MRALVSVRKELPYQSRRWVAFCTARTSTSGNYGYLLLPTPGQINNSNTVAGFVNDPRFNIDRGFFDAPIDVIITSPTPGATSKTPSG